MQHHSANLRCADVMRNDAVSISWIVRRHAVFVWRLRRAVVVLNCMRRYRGFKIVYCSLDVDSERLRRPYISTVLKFRDAEHYRRGDKSRR